MSIVESTTNCVRGKFDKGNVIPFDKRKLKRALDKAKTETMKAPVNVWQKDGGRFFHYGFSIGGVKYGNRSTGLTKRDEAIAYAQAEKEKVFENLAAMREAVHENDMLLDDVAEFWWELMGKTYRDTGERPPSENMFRQVKRTVQVFGPTTLVSQMTLTYFLQVRAGLLEEKPRADKRGRPRGNGLKPKSINHILATAMMLLYFIQANRKDIALPHMPNPTKDRLYLAVQPRSRHFDFIEAHMFAEACEDLGFSDLWDGVEFQIETGMRPNELAALLWQQIDWTPGRESVTFFVKGHGHDRRPHTVFLTRKALEVLDRRRDPRVLHDERVFTSTTLVNHCVDGVKIEAGTRTPWAHNRYGDEFELAALYAGMDDIEPHDCRRTAARRVWLSAGIELAQALLGHLDRKTTLRYIGINEEDSLAAREAIRIDEARTGAALEAAAALQGAGKTAGKTVGKIGRKNMRKANPTSGAPRDPVEAAHLERIAAELARRKRVAALKRREPEVAERIEKALESKRKRDAAGRDVGVAPVAKTRKVETKKAATRAARERTRTPLSVEPLSMKPASTKTRSTKPASTKPASVETASIKSSSRAAAARSSAGATSNVATPKVAAAKRGNARRLSA